jgi:DNA-binding transcriptional LysR family regulator
MRPAASSQARRGTFRSIHPHVRFQVLLTNGLLDMVSDNIDVALRIGASNPQDAVMRQVLSFHYGLLASPAWLQQHEEPAELAAVSNLIAPPKPLRTYLEDVVLGGQPLPQADIEADSCLLVRDLVLAGSGIGLLPIGLCAREVAAGDLVPVLSHAIKGPVRLSLSFPARADMTERVRVFADHLAKRLGQG